MDALDTMSYIIGDAGSYPIGLKPDFAPNFFGIYTTRCEINNCTEGEI